ncbi:hypothetical protein ABUK00_07740 [Raoultella planticola]|uniref:hypothetical protein n=1 Tax=Raoultella planticola TaxID=575 RepID=UPI0015F145A2|nr:hypothetical protein [Raoultella planticola]MDY7622545.1 hypothetical protein [Raoultella planticola]
MSYYIRSIKSEFWENELPNGGHMTMPTDCITNCLKTTSNSLSIWKTESLEIHDECNKNLLAAIALSVDRPKQYKVVFISDEELEELGLTLAETLGDTPFEEYQHTHRDITNLTLDTIGKFAWLIQSKVNDDGEFIDIVSVEEVVDFIKNIFPDKDSLPDKPKSCKKWRDIYQ